MLGAAPTYWRQRSRVAAVTILALGVLVGGRAEAATDPATVPVVPQVMWPVYVDATAAPSITGATFVKPLRGKPVNALIVNGKGMTLAGLKRLERLSAAARIPAFVMNRPVSGKTTSSVNRCSVEGGTSAVRCLRTAGSVLAARRLARGKTAAVVVVRVKSETQFRQLRGTTGTTRILALIDLRAGSKVRSTASWRRMIRLSRAEANLDVALAPLRRGTGKTLNDYSSVLASELRVTVSGGGTTAGDGGTSTSGAGPAVGTTGNGGGNNGKGNGNGGGGADTSAPTTPSNLARTAASGTSISISWEASTDKVGVAGYTVYQGSVVVATTTVLAATFAGLTCSTAYLLGVEAYDAAGNRSARATLSTQTSACSGATPADTSAPSVPQGMAFSAKTQTSVTLVWLAATDNVAVTGYHVYRNGVRIASPTALTYLFSGLTCGTTYTFALEAHDAAGNVSLRAEATGSATTNACDSAPVPAPAPAPAPGASAALFVATNGSDSNPCTQAAPCASFARAYRVAQLGAVVEVAGGVYPGQALVFDSTKAFAGPHVEFRPAAGASVSLSGLKLGTNVTSGDGPWNVTIKNMRIVNGSGKELSVAAFAGTNGVLWENLDAANFYLNGVKNFTVRGGDWGPCTSSDNQPVDLCSNSKIDGNSAPFGNENITIDGARFHDYRIVLGSGAHFECMFLNGGRNVTIRNSRFENCAFYDIFVARRSGDALDGLLLENNWFDTPWNEAPSGPSQGRSGAVSFSHGGRTTDPWKNVLIRFNSFHASTGISWNEDGGSYTTSNNRVIGNIFQNQSCDTSRWSYAYNLVNGVPCGATDRNVGSSFPYVNAAHLPSGNWRLSGGIAVDFVTGGGSDYALASDIDGGARPLGAARDAGAHEAN